MPQMGESVAEGTIVRWIKKIGDAVERDEPLFEISTDKVDAEIPSPAAGVLSEIKVKEGETVAINTVVAVIGEQGQPPGAGGAQGTEGDETAKGAAPASAPAAQIASAGKPAAPSAPASASAPAAQIATADRPPVPSAPLAPQSGRPWSAAEARAMRLSPLVRKIARDHRIDVRNIAGSGAGGRITKTDILSYIEAGAPAFAPTSQTASAGRPGAPAAPLAPHAPAAPVSRGIPPDKIERVPMSVMRRRIAEHMVMSRQTSAHVHSVFEVDFTRVDEIRRARKAEHEKAGAKLTYLSFITKAVASALKAVPIVNASVEGSDVLYKKEINIGIAVALDWGLIVPVVKQADQKNLLEITKSIADLAGRARDKKLSTDDVQGGTFTITNPGVFGALFGMPIINQPQVAILGVGAIEKRPVVADDAIVARLRAYLTLGYDHRLIDGAVADEFMSHLKKGLETFAAEP
jgi:pyruvate dehydrogenase E2 component (dihydrolipoamide acetyltransferase)